MHLRQFLAALAFGSTVALLASAASAQQIYKWKDAQGVTHFSQTPPASGTHYSKMHLSGLPEVSSSPSSAPATAEPPPQDDSDATASVAPPRAGSGDTQADTPSNRSKLCKQLQSNIALLQGKQPVVRQGANGKQEVMSDSARSQQLATARAQQVQYCASQRS